ncbi:MAG: hypothetical protein RMK89_08980 [Armatimonadota bacterium]|nr:ATP-binding protein [Armatimonadota bacterium]MDW8143580.1 hypothetical protein [Armatimonadota bacterium]
MGRSHRELTELLKRFPDSEEAQMLFLRWQESSKGIDEATHAETSHPSAPLREIGFSQSEAVAIPTEPSMEDLGWEDERVASGFFQIFRPEPTPLKFSDIGGLEEVKEQIRLTIIYPLQQPEVKRRATCSAPVMSPSVFKRLQAAAAGSACRTTAKDSFLACRILFRRPIHHM